MRRILLVLALALLTGCGGSSSPPPSPPQSPARHPRRPPTPGEEIAVIKEAMQKFQVQLRRSPKDLSELVRLGYLKEVPAPPEGKAYYYDPELGNVNLVTAPPQLNTPAK